MIHINHPDPKLLKALSDAGVLPPQCHQPAPVARTSSAPRKRRKYAAKTVHPVRQVATKTQESWAPFVCMILAIVGLALMFHR
jgi:hypothetical protein